MPGPHPEGLTQGSPAARGPFAVVLVVIYWNNFYTDAKGYAKVDPLKPY